MSENSQGRLLLAEKDFVDVVNDEGEVVGSVPKHWDDSELAPGLKKKAKAKASRSGSTAATGGDKKPDGEPAGNASTDDWVAYARAKGATDADLVDGDGEPLGREELREKYGTPKS